MDRADKILKWIDDNLRPLHREVLNESGMHNVPKGSETHFRLVIVSALFENKSLLERHRVIQTGLAEEFQKGPAPLHALSLQLYTESEWAERSQTTPSSPLCLGGKKHPP